MIVRRGMYEGQNYAPRHFRNPFYNALARVDVRARAYSRVLNALARERG